MNKLNINSGKLGENVSINPGKHTGKSTQISPGKSLSAEDAYLVFGFKYFIERELFALKSGSIPNSWMLSFFDKIKSLSKVKKDSLSDKEKKRAHRYHPVDWNAKNIPIQKKDLGLPRDYLDDTEYPFYQFQISRGTGRFAGFYDENGIFQIVLVDPLHNLQPSKDYNYEVNDCRPLGTSYELLVAKLHETHVKCSSIKSCPHKDSLKELATMQGTNTIIICDMDEELCDQMKQFLDEGHPVSYSDVFNTGLFAWKEEAKRQ